MRHNNPLQATRWSGHFVFNRQAQRAPERERYALICRSQDGFGTIALLVGDDHERFTKVTWYR